MHEYIPLSREEQLLTADMGRTEPLILIDYYTDPLCSWSWAFEAQWRRLRYVYGGQMRWRYRMGGLLPNWQSYDDPFNDIH